VLISKKPILGLWPQGTGEVMVVGSRTVRVVVGVEVVGVMLGGPVWSVERVWVGV
jgi:hypothetical protein